MNLAQFQGQSAQPGLSVKNLSEIEILMPPKKIQDNIARVILNIDHKIALNRAINQNLRARREQRESPLSLCRAEAVNGDVSRNLEATPDRSSRAVGVRRAA